LHSYPEAGLGVHIASDKQIFRSGVFAASHGISERNVTFSAWGNRPVLVMICVRLGLSGVNPLYYETVKVNLHTSPSGIIYLSLTLKRSDAVYIPTVGWHCRRKA